MRLERESREFNRDAPDSWLSAEAEMLGSGFMCLDSLGSEICTVCETGAICDSAVGEMAQSDALQSAR